MGARAPANPLRMGATQEFDEDGGVLRCVAFRSAKGRFWAERKTTRANVSIRPYQEQSRLIEHAGLALADRLGKIKTPGARGFLIDAIAECQIRQAPFAFGLSRFGIAVHGDRDHGDAALLILRQDFFQAAEIGLADRAMQPAIEHDHAEVFRRGLA